MSDYSWHWRIKQDGMFVASGICPDRKSMVLQMGHYAMAYRQDGPLDAIQTRTGKNKWRDYRDE